MAEHVLAVFAAHDDHVLAGRVGHDLDGHVRDARVVIAPLRREQVGDGNALCAGLEQG